MRRLLNNEVAFLADPRRKVEYKDLFLICSDKKGKLIIYKTILSAFLEQPRADMQNVDRTAFLSMCKTLIFYSFFNLFKNLSFCCLPNILRKTMHIA